ncbi:MAG: T9SS type A sorting domain-containing protein [Ignavibacteria bacterium]|jgi:hypothetical protein
MKTIFSLLLSFTLLIQFASAQSKKVLFEEFTNASCSPCALNNPFLKSFIESKGDTIVAIMYHTNFPGFDPMHNANPIQVEERRTGYYTDVNAVPWLKGDGDLFPDIWPFTLANFNSAFDTRKNVIPQLTMSLSDQRIPGDSIRATIRINIPATLPSGNYRLRVMAVEGVIEYSTPPGTNGERIFEHVFRKGIPDMNGTVLSTSAGNYEYIYTYKKETDWQDTSIYTVAFVQNDLGTKEVLNCASGRNIVTGLNNVSSEIPIEFALNQNFPNPFNPVTTIGFTLPQNEVVKLVVYNVLGKEVTTIFNQALSAGEYEFGFNGEMLTSGVYFYKLTSGDVSITKTMMLMK